MSFAEMLIVLLAGAAAGAINAVIGSGTLFTFPVLLSLGFPPVTATMSNAIGLVAGSVSGTWGYRRELAGQRQRVLRLVPASLLGSVTGAWLLLRLPDETFEAVVPALLVLALVLVVTQTRIQRALARRREREAAKDPRGEGRSGKETGAFAATYLIGVYGGYFTAAQGILLVGALGVLVPETLQRLNALKNLLALVVNIVAACTYTIFAYDRISWTVAGLIAAGSLAGGFVGAGVGRRLHPAVLRGVIVVLGVVGIWRILAG